MKEVYSNNIYDTEEQAEKFIEDIMSSYTVGDSAFVIGLYGELGSGKTAFMKGAAKALGVTDIVTSPTFVIEKIYSLQNKPFKKLIHIDAYRLKDENELLSLGWEELKKDPRNIIFIEWPNKIKNILPKSMLTIEFKFINEATRSIVFK